MEDRIRRAEAPGSSRSVVAVRHVAFVSEFGHWLIGRAHELAAARLKASNLRAQAVQYGPALEARGASLMARWLSEIDALTNSGSLASG